MPKKIDWSYHRPGCTTCGKTQKFLADAGLQATEEVNAKKNTLTSVDALALAEQVQDIYAAKGKKVVHLNMKKDRPDEATLKQVLVGPTGNLRAPTLRIGKTLVVGFEEGMYQQIFG